MFLSDDTLKENLNGQFQKSDIEINCKELHQRRTATHV